MIGMIKKDLFITRIYALIFLLISFCYAGTWIIIKTIIFKNEIQDTDFSRNCLALLPLLLVMEFNCKSYQFDRMGKQSEKYMNSLPLSSSGIVLAKFISSAIFTTYGLLISMLCMTVFTMTDSLPLTFSLYRNIWIAYFSILLVLFIQMPVLVYNGNELLSLLAPAICAAVPFVIALCFHNFNINEVIMSLSGFMTRHTFIRNNLACITFTLTMLIGFVSFYVSAQIYKRREF